MSSCGFQLARPTPTVFLAGSAAVLLPWSGWLATSLPCRYVSQHWGIAWAGFDLALATALALTSVAALRRAPWLDRAAVAAATLLGTDAWFDVVTSRGAGGLALALGEALALELPIAFFCVQLAQRFVMPAGAPVVTGDPTGSPSIMTAAVGSPGARGVAPRRSALAEVPVTPKKLGTSLRPLDAL